MGPSALTRSTIGRQGKASTRNDRNELRLALDFEGGKSEIGEDSFPELYLTPARRQKLQKPGVIERVDTAGEYYLPRRCPLSPFGRRVAEFLRAEHVAWAAERDRVKADIRAAKKRLRASGGWGRTRCPAPGSQALAERDIRA